MTKHLPFIAVAAQRAAMRIVSWNCCQGFDAKAAALMSLSPDIAVVAESHQSPEIAQASLLEREVPHLWTGSIQNKGLGIFAPRATSFELAKAEQGGPGDHAVAGRAVHGLEETIVVGVWTVPNICSGDPYLDAASAIIERYASLLRTDRAIVAGDFNLSGRTCLAGLTVFAREMRERFGLVSAYHAYHGISIGAERDATLWWRRAEKSAFHCDFVFVPTAWTITRVTVGSYADWGAKDAVARSDHAPIIVDVKR